MREYRLRWFIYIKRKGNSEAVRITIEINVEEKTGRERPKKRWTK